MKTILTILFVACYQASALAQFELGLRLGHSVQAFSVFSEDWLKDVSYSSGLSLFMQCTVYDELKVQLDVNYQELNAEFSLSDKYKYSIFSDRLLSRGDGNISLNYLHVPMTIIVDSGQGQIKCGIGIGLGPAFFLNGATDIREEWRFSIFEPERVTFVKDKDIRSHYQLNDISLLWTGHITVRYDAGQKGSVGLQLTGKLAKVRREGVDIDPLDYALLELGILHYLPIIKKSRSQ